MLGVHTETVRTVFLGDGEHPDSGIIELLDVGLPDIAESEPQVGLPARGVFLLSLQVDVHDVLSRLEGMGLGGTPRTMPTPGGGTCRHRDRSRRSDGGVASAGQAFGHEIGEPVDISSVDELLSTTRAVRRRLDLHRPVEREVILDCVRLAMQAPTASNDQNWRWVVVTDADKRAAIAEIYRSAGADYLADAARSATDPQTRRVYESAHAFTDTLADVPVHVIPCIEKRFDGSNLLVAASAWGSIMPAAWSFQLALRSRGLGSVWTTLHLAREREVAELLGIPDTVTQVALFPVAYTIGTEFKPASRPPPETVTSWNTWGNR